MWQLAGYGLLIWAIFDLFWGHTYLHRAISMKEEGWIFWPTWLVYLGIAVSLILWG